MFIVFDTNIWVAELAFRSNLGSAVRSFIVKRGATVAVPEIVKREVELHIETKLADAAAGIRKAHRELLAIFGEMQAIQIPSPEQIKAKAESVIAELDVPKRHLSFSLEAARSSLEKVLRKQQPSGDKNQQFKDGVIWADCLTLAQEANVYLISDDKAFYKELDRKNGLAPNLETEARACPFRIHLLKGLADLLPQISSTFYVNEINLAKEITQSRMFSDNPVNMNGFVIQNSPVFKTKLFHTENANRIYLEFEADFPCSDPTDDFRPDGHLICTGHCDYNPVTQEASGAHLTNMILHCTTLEGEATSTGVVMGSGAISIGTPMISHSIRRPVE